MVRLKKYIVFDLRSSERHESEFTDTTEFWEAL